MAVTRIRALAATLAAGLVLSAVAVSATSLESAQAAQGASNALGSETYGEAIEAAEKEKSDLEQQIKDAESALEDTNAEIVAANKRLQDLNARLPIAQEEYDLATERLEAALFQQQVVEARLVAAEAQDEAIGKQIAEDEARLEELRETVAEFARQSYRGKDADAGLRLVLGSATTDDFVDEYTTQSTVQRTQSSAFAEMEQIAAINRNLGARQAAVRDYILELQAIAADLVKEADAARLVAEAKKAEIEQLLVEQKELKAFLQAQKAAQLKVEAALEEEYKQARLEILILSRKRLLNGDDVAIGDGIFQRPTSSSVVTSPYGYRIHPIYGYRRLHTGTDLRAYCGNPIYAMGDGIVEYTKYSGGYGNQVALYHGAPNGQTVYSTYSHLSKFNVSSGDLVLRGEVIAYSGTTGSSTACHLHWEVFINGGRVDPMTVI